MNCHEAGELMQRYLDKVLLDSEEESMQAHLRHCTQCSKLFNRFKYLTSELDLLPKVTPPYSLVDAIMPQLERLELEHVSKLATGRHVPQRTTWFRKLRENVSYRALGAVLVASLVFGVFIMNQDQLLPGKSGSAKHASPEVSSINNSVALNDTAASAARDQTPSGTVRGSGNEDLATLKSARPTTESQIYPTMNIQSQRNFDSTDVANKEDGSVGIHSSPYSSEDERFGITSLTVDVPSAEVRSPVASPDGTMVAEAFSHEDGTWQVMIHDLNGADIFVSHRYEAQAIDSIDWLSEQALTFHLVDAESRAVTINLNDGTEMVD